MEVNPGSKPAAQGTRAVCRDEARLRSTLGTRKPRPRHFRNSFLSLLPARRRKDPGLARLLLASL